MSADHDDIVRTISAFFPDDRRALRAAKLLFEAGVPRSSVLLVTGGEEGRTTRFDEEHHQGPLDALAEFFIPEEDFEDKSRQQSSSLSISDLPAELHAQAALILENEGARVEVREVPKGE